MNSFHPQNSRVDELLPVPGLNRKHLQEGDGLICRHICPASLRPRLFGVGIPAWAGVFYMRADGGCVAADTTDEP